MPACSPTCATAYWHSTAATPSSGASIAPVSPPCAPFPWAAGSAASCTRSWPGAHRPHPPLPAASTPAPAPALALALAAVAVAARRRRAPPWWSAAALPERRRPRCLPSTASPPPCWSGSRRSAGAPAPHLCVSLPARRYRWSAASTPSSANTTTCAICCAASRPTSTSWYRWTTTRSSARTGHASRWRTFPGSRRGTSSR